MRRTALLHRIPQCLLVSCVFSYGFKAQTPHIINSRPEHHCWCRVLLLAADPVNNLEGVEANEGAEMSCPVGNVSAAYMTALQRFA
jgi:hypothetical protein